MLAVITGAVIRLIVSVVFVTVRNHDTIGWATVGAWTLQGKNIYPYPAYEFHSFFPAFLYVNAAAVWLQRFGIAPMLFNKLFCSLFDVGSIWLVYLLTGRNRKAAWLYALNPLSIIITCVHGQLESIPVFFLLLGIYLLKTKKPVWSGIALSFAVLFKTWPLLFTIPLLKRVWKWWYIPLIGLAPLAAMTIYTLIFHAKYIDMIHYALFYRGQTGGWGMGYFLRFLLDDKWSLRIFSNAYLLVFASFSFFNKQKTISEEILDQMLFFFILSPTFGIQWLMWIVPFLIIVRPKWYIAFFLTATLYIGNINVFWILQERYLALVKYVTQFGLLAWATLALVALNRKLKLRPYIVVTDHHLPGNKEGNNNQKSGK